MRDRQDAKAPTRKAGDEVDGVVELARIAGKAESERGARGVGVVLAEIRSFGRRAVFELGDREQRAFELEIRQAADAVHLIGIRRHRACQSAIHRASVTTLDMVDPIAELHALLR